MNELTQMTPSRIATSGSRPPIALVFGGQGTQHRGMGKDLFVAFRTQVDAASDILGYRIDELCLDDPERRLSQTLYAQPAIYVVNALRYAALAESGETRLDSFIYAGHSLGEFNALQAAGAFSFEAGLRLVAARARLMQAASGGAMAAVIGACATDLATLLKPMLRRGVLELANFNAPTQTVMSGGQGEIARATEFLRQAGLHVVPLDVAGAFHTAQMDAAAASFADVLARCAWTDPGKLVVANVSGRPYAPGELGRTLALQMTSPVQWVQTIEYMLDAGVTEFVEIGGNRLSRLIEEIRREYPSRGTKLAGPEVPAMAGMTPTPNSTLFCERYRVRMPYVAGGMYRGISSSALVTRMGRAGLLSFFGAGGLALQEIEDALVMIEKELGRDGIYGVNVMAGQDTRHDQFDLIRLLLDRGVRNIEAAAYLRVTPSLVWFRASGLVPDGRGGMSSRTHLIAKVSRTEVAEAFMSPAPRRIVSDLLSSGLITEAQAAWLDRVPVSTDICVEADSGGHTDGRNPSVLLPQLIGIRDRVMRQYGYAEKICVGAAGGIGTPEAALAAFLLGADFVLTGSINQCTVQAAISDEAKALLEAMDISDTAYAPAGDMFELGAKVQVLKKGVLFPARANKLFNLYSVFGGLAEIPPHERQQLERAIFRRPLEQVWVEVRQRLVAQGRHDELAAADANPKLRMAMVFRWYFHHSGKAARQGDGDQRANFQIHTGPALGAFNHWVRDTPLASWHNRHVDDMAVRIMTGVMQRLSSIQRLVGSPSSTGG